MGRRMFLLSVAVSVILGAGCEASVTGPNRAPFAAAGPDLQVDLSTTVTLDGSASWDPDDDALTMEWANFSPGPAIPHIIPHIRLCIPFPFAEEVAAGELAKLQLAGPGDPTTESTIGFPVACADLSTKWGAGQPFGKSHPPSNRPTHTAKPAIPRVILDSTGAVLGFVSAS
jgi:hypothetical protein